MAIKIRFSIQAAKVLFAAILAAAVLCPQGRAATLLPPGESCFQATAGVNGMVGLLGTITGGTGGTTGTYGGVALTGGSGSGATANITVSGGAVTAVAILNPGITYVVGDVLSAASGNIGGVAGFSVPVSSTSINSSLAGGTAAFYVPNNNTFKQTWFDSDQASIHQNTNPVQLDANGCAIIYGSGIYRQVLKDSLGNTVWDQLTADTSSSNSTFWTGISGGTPNAVTVTDAGFNSTDGSIIYFQALNSNTGATTLSPSGVGPYSVVKDTSTGPVTLSGGEIAANGVIGVLFTSSTSQFHLIDYIQSSGSATATITPPQGYLNLVGAVGGIIQTSDVISATAVYYTPFTGSQIPIYNGSSFAERTFSELTLTLTAGNNSANGIYDACVFNNAGTPVLVTGPAWSTPTAGSGARGTGAGTPELFQLNGFWVNKNSITGNNNGVAYSIPALQCTYVGSLYIDTTAGQVSTLRTFGQNRKWGVWNAYNAQKIVLNAGDSTASWGYATATYRASNAAPAAWTSTVCNYPIGTACNGAMIFTGLPTEEFTVRYTQAFSNITAGGGNASQTFRSEVSLNSAVTGGAVGNTANVYVAAVTSTTVYSANYVQAVIPPGIGVNSLITLEYASGGCGSSCTWYGTNANMSMLVEWRG